MKKLLSALIIATTLVLNLAVVPALAADTNKQIFSPCDINKKTAGSPICGKQDPNTNPINKTIKTAADIVALATGVAAVIIIIIGGLTMVTSAGNAEAVASSRKRITYAVIGLVIVAFSWTIIAFVTDKLIL